jgi:Tfp pilus assembly protein PilO
MSRIRLIAVLGALTLGVLAAVAWLLVLSPRVGAAAEIDAQSDTVRNQTSSLQREIVQLEATKSRLPERVGRFEQLKASFPRTAEIPALLDQIRSAAAQSGVSVQTLETSAPVLVVPGGDTGDAATGQDGTAGTAAAPSPAPTPATTATTASPDGSSGVGVPVQGADGTLATMPMSVTMSGSYQHLTNFLKRAEELPRAWLIDTLSAQAGEGGKIALTASGNMFVLDTTGIAVPGADD